MDLLLVISPDREEVFELFIGDREWNKVVNIDR